MWDGCVGIVFLDSTRRMVESWLRRRMNDGQAKDGWSADEGLLSDGRGEGQNPARQVELGYPAQSFSGGDIRRAATPLQLMPSSSF